MKKSIINLVILVCVTWGAIHVFDTFEDSLHDQRVGSQGFDANQSKYEKNISTERKSNVNYRLNGRDTKKLGDNIADKHLDSELSELREKILSAETNEEFIKTVADIEYGAEFKDVTPLVKELLEVWIEKDLRAALDFSNGMSARYEDNVFRLHAIKVAAINSIGDTQEWLDTNSFESQQEQDMNTLAVYSGHAANDPVDALYRADEIDDSYIKYRLEVRALHEWSQHDPLQALDWIENHSNYSDPLYIAKAYLSVVKPMIHSAPLQAESIILAMEPSDEKNELVSEYSKKLAQADGVIALQWAQTLEDIQVYSTAVRTVLEYLAGSKSEQVMALDYALGETNQDLRSQFVVQTIGYIAKHNPKLAATELSLLPFEEQKQIAMSIAFSFPEEDISQRDAWIKALPNEELRSLVAQFAAK